VSNIAGSLSQVSREDIIERAIAHFRRADADYGERIAKAVRERRAK
jgi:catalase